ncbi:hypothetical protein OESDEN_09106 [Oesophagostomum dentatum]|uniref:Uncharacterized protein n=1 Tax=Oesophagostomum dentatum TaxID=61180 RepID=A0A0B1T6L6_OESDE|nr:hypothetical protein OESDEN_09106 [Oesophagostomum dentatum]
MKQFAVLLLTTLASAEIFSNLRNPEVPAQSLPEVDVKIIPTHIDITKLREAYATVSAGERFLPSPSRLSFDLFGEEKRK